MHKKKYIFLVVQYEKPLFEIPIVRISEELNALSIHCADLVVHDNSKSRDKRAVEGSFHYHHAGSNVGTAGAYRYGLDYASKRNIEWLVLLDQDTAINRETIQKIDDQMCEEIDSRVGARLPKIKEGNKNISPCTVSFIGSMGNINNKLSKGAMISGISSGAVVRVDLFKEIINEMPPKIWLDYVDHWMYLACQKKGYRIDFLDMVLEHKLSINDIKSLSPERIRSICDGERAYCKELGFVAYVFWMFRIVFRMVRCAAKDPIYLKKVIKAYVG